MSGREVWRVGSKAVRIRLEFVVNYEQPLLHLPVVDADAAYAAIAEMYCDAKVIPKSMLITRLRQEIVPVPMVPIDANADAKKRVPRAARRAR